MTSRPVFERPRLMRTLLCLLIGVLALLWRAVPSFSWAPPWCDANPHSHQMETLDVAFWRGFCLGQGQQPTDCARLIRWAGGNLWVVVPRDSCYGYCCVFRYQTWTSVPSHSVCHTYKFDATINFRTHCNTTTATYCHYCGCWTTVREMYGFQLDMSI